MQDTLQIRPYKRSDRDVVISLWEACGLTHPSNNPHKDIERKLRVDPERFLVGVLDGQVIATVMAGYDGHRGVINYLGVLPHCQRRGFAKQMLAEAERLLRAAGCPKINLQVREANVDAMRFYEGIGYTRDRVVQFGKRLEFDSPDAAPTAPGNT